MLTGARFQVKKTKMEIFILKTFFFTLLILWWHKF